jgi:hypothetical protein
LYTPPTRCLFSEENAMTVTAAANALASQGVFTLNPPSLLARTVREAGLLMDRSAAGHDTAIGVRDLAARLGAEFPHVPAWALALLGGAMLIPAA